MPQRGLLGGLDLRQVEHHRAAQRRQAARGCWRRRCAASTIEAEKPDAVGPAHVPIVEVQAAGAEERRGEVELRAPSRRRSAGRGSRATSAFISAATCAGDLEEHRVARQRQRQVALVVERHRRHLAEGVLAVEHPAVGAREQRVGDVAQAALDRRAAAGRPGRCPESTAARGRPGSRAPSKRPSRASATRMAGARDDGVGVEEADRRAGRAPARRGARSAPASARPRSRSNGASASMRGQRGRGEDIGVGRERVTAPCSGPTAARTNPNSACAGV